MERGRRHRRGRGHSRTNSTNMACTPSPPHPKPWSFFSGLYSFFIMTSLIALIYLMLEYHCNNCNHKCNINNITQSIDDIAKNLSFIKDSYYDLETKISRFSQDMPKLEGQIYILEALANTLEKSHLGRGPKSQLPLPNVDVMNKRFNVPKNASSKRCCASVFLPPKTVDVSQD